MQSAWRRGRGPRVHALLFSDEDKMQIVIGVDGSLASEKVLRWASKHSDSGDDLRALTAFGQDMPGFGFAPISKSEWEHEALVMVRDAVTRAFGGSPPRPISCEATSGDPAEVLLNAGRSIDLLVIGNRGTGERGELRWGRTAEKCAHHATCPTVIVPFDLHE
jgi:nucleotide-binding universal stress UspA family protein